MISVYDIFLRIPDLLGKDQYGKYVTPLNFNQKSPWVDIALMDKFIAEFESTRIVSNNLRPFFKTLGTPEDPKLTFDSFGRAPLPDDFYYFSSANTDTFVNQCGGYTGYKNNVEWVDNATFADRISSQEMQPTEEYPIATYTNKSGVPCVMVAPVTTKMAFTYLRKPVQAVLTYSLSNGTVIPNTVTSVNPEWPDSAKNDYVEAYVQEYARAIHDQMDMQNSLMAEAKG